MNQHVTFGIAGFGYAFGEDQSVESAAESYVTDPERVMRWGYSTFHRAPDGTTATDLAAAAARDALVQAGVSTGAVDLVAIATSDVPEYLNWDSSAALAGKLNLGEVQTMLLNEGCACGVTGLASVAGVFAIQPEINTAVFVAVNRVSEYHRNRMTTNNAVHSDGAVAVVLRRDHPSLRWLATDQFTDPDLCDFFRTEYGGSVAPMPPPGWSSATASPGHERVMAHFNRDPDRLRAFGAQVNDRIIAVVDGACKRAGISRDQVAHLIHINDPDGINDLAPLFDLPLERTNFAIAGAHGHMGAADQLVALGTQLERGEVAPGDVVALVGISIGMRWYCSLIQIRPVHPLMKVALMNSLLDDVRAAVQQGHAPTSPVRAALAQAQDPGIVRRVGRVLEGLLEGREPDDGVLRSVQVAVLATCTTGPLPALLRAALVGVGLQPRLRVAEYGTFELSLAGAGFAADGQPDVVACLLDDSYFLPMDWSGHDVAALVDTVRERLRDLRGLIVASAAATTATLVLHTVPLPVHTLESLLSWRARAALAQAWYQLNADLLGLAQDHPQVTVVDLASLLAGTAAATRDDRLHRYADLPYTDDALLVLAKQVARVAQAKLGLSRKVLAVDLDNTLWGGVLGEVGAAGVQLGGLYPGNCYHQLQLTIRRLREQGVILVLVSKNDADSVEAALGTHPAMVLRSDAFSYRAVNWTGKAQNLRAAAASLDLPTSAFVFLDDSPFEREAIAHELPEVALVAADGDPAHLVASLLRQGHFDVMALTETDLARPRLYQERAQRNDFSGGFGSTRQYLAALGLELTATPVGGYEVARVAQLSARTNQFNLTGAHFDEAETAAMAGDPDHLVAAFGVIDRFGDEGIVGAAWVDRDSTQWTVRNLVLSCRVLSRGVELAIVGWLAGQARQAGAGMVHGRYVSTGRNGVAADLWQRAGFVPAPTEGDFTLDLNAAVDPSPEWIKVRERSVI